MSPDTASPNAAPADLAELQRAMAAAVLGGDRAAAEASIVADRIAPADRLDVYAGTVRISLTQALEAAFPVVARLVGERFFHAAARRFVEAHPPQRPQLLSYGGGFADFLAAFEPARSLPYLPDVARLEWARVQALFAADAAPLAAEALGEVPAEAMPRLVFDLHPSLRVVASAWPIQAIWQANRQPTVPKVDLGAGGQTVLVLRPAHAVTAQPIAPA
ncbi:MAG: DUF2063 domain-containing protein, partial [Alphaproteobacteria bacterium]|nr:DUF2063 domain-containing protein [Alphaproteobacteria bacterium]